MLRNDFASPPERWAVVVSVCALTISLFYCTLGDLLQAYSTQRTYSHGLLVIPAALCLLWLRRPLAAPPHSALLIAGNSALLIPGAAMLAISVAMHLMGIYFYLPFLRYGALLLWLLGLIQIWGGGSLSRPWLPGWGFLTFAIPLPYTAEAQLLLPLQGLATRISCCLLVLSGQPAYAQGTQIHVLDHPVTVAPACSGLSLMLSTVALSYFYCFAVDRPPMQRFVLLISAVPIAIAVNALRIAVTCGMVTGEVSGREHLLHELLGWLSVPLAVVPLTTLSCAMYRLSGRTTATAC